MNALFQAVIEVQTSARSVESRSRAIGAAGLNVDGVVAVLNEAGSHELLETRTRALIALALVTAARVALPTLKAHVNAAFDAGATADEVSATIREAALYSGIAAASAGLDAVRTVSSEAGAD
jgi:alkylhydroperoxidase/carboxymuconolactone decarboxylase family protein YurZ